MANSTVTIRIDSDVKEHASELCESLGTDLSSAVRMFVYQMVRESRIPVDLSLEVPNAETLAAIAEGERMLASKETTYYKSAAEMFDAMGVQ